MIKSNPYIHLTLLCPSQQSEEKSALGPWSVLCRLSGNASGLQISPKPLKPLAESSGQPWFISNRLFRVYNQNGFLSRSKLAGERDISWQSCQTMMKMSMTLVSMLTIFTISESHLQFPQFDVSKHFLAPSGMIILINVLLCVCVFDIK